MVCLDTDVIINFLRNDQETVKTVSDLLKSGNELKTTAINVLEIWKGYYKSRRQDMLVGIEKILLQLQILPFDEVDAQRTAEIFENLQSEGKTVDTFDIM